MLIVYIGTLMYEQKIIMSALQCLIVIIYGILCFKAVPFTTKTLNYVSLFSTFIQVLSILMMMVVATIDDNNNGFSIIISIGIIIINIILLVIMFFLMLDNVRK